MSATRRGARTPHREAPAAEHNTGGNHVADGKAAAHGAQRPSVKESRVTFRIDADTGEHLDAIGEQLGIGRSETIRFAVDTVAAALGSAKTEKAAQRALERKLASEQVASVPVAPDIEQHVMEDLRDALQELSAKYAKRARQLQSIGHNWNQLAKWANTGETVDTDALNAIKRQLASIEQRMAEDSRRDVRIEEVLSWLR